MLFKVVFVVVKSFNVSEDIYRRFALFCRERGISMSRQVQFFMESVLDKEPQASKKFLKRLDKVRSGKFIVVEDFGARYGLK